MIDDDPQPFKLTPVHREVIAEMEEALRLDYRLSVEIAEQAHKHTARREARRRPRKT